MKLIIILGLLLTYISYSTSIRIKNNKNNNTNKQYYNGNPTYNPGYQPAYNQAAFNPHVYAVPNNNYGYAMRAAPSNESYIEMTRSQTDKPIKIANVL